MANPLVYNDTELYSAIKSFKVQAQAFIVIKIVLFVAYAIEK